MPYCDSKKVIFLHVPKTGGTTIKRVFDIQQLHDSNPATVPSPQHFTCAMLRDYIGVEKYRRYYKFAVVRNPWARIVSSYFWRQSLPKKRIVPPFHEFVFDLQMIVSERQFYELEFGDHFIPQSEYTSDVDDVFRFEDFPGTVKSIAARLTLPEPILPPNKQGKYGGYAQYYSVATRNIVADIYADEIRDFGYQFEQ